LWLERRSRREGNFSSGLNVWWWWLVASSHSLPLA
jgi:hypothetical protein